MLLDLGLPDATGLQALRALRAVADLTPIIVLTGSDDYKQGLIAVREGAQDYLEKRRVNAGMLSRIVSYSVERNNFHRDLVRATRRYQDLFNNVPVALFTANSDGVLKTANAACMKLLSCQGIPLDKVNFLDLLFEPGKRAHFLDLMSRQRMVEGWETSIQDCKGNKLHVLINTAPLYDADQAFAGWEGCITDISMLKQTLEERDRLEDNLRQAQKLEAIGQLAAGIAHEINTPTQYVGDNLRFLKESFGELDTLLAQLVNVGGEPASELLGEADFDYLKEEIPRALNQSLEGVDRVAKIVRAMKEFSHPAREKTATDLNRAIQSTITVASNEWKYVAEIEMDLDANLPVGALLAGRVQPGGAQHDRQCRACDHRRGRRRRQGQGQDPRDARGPRANSRSWRSPTRARACRRTSSSASSIRSSPPRKWAREPARAWPSPTT